MKIKMKTAREVIFVFVALLSGIAISSADPLLSRGETAQILCLNEGEIVPFSQCNPEMRNLVCTTDRCEYCVVAENSCPLSLGTCYSKGLRCDEMDNTPENINDLEISIDSPQEGGIYDDDSVMVDASFGTNADAEVLIGEDGRERWKTLCNRCSDYQKKVTFKEGFNNVTFHIQSENAEQEESVSRSFIVDSKKPKFTDVQPTRGYASGVFKVKFAEENAEKVILVYGNEISGMKEKVIPLANCVLGEKDISCTESADLREYDGQKIEYYFVVQDIVGREERSKTVTLSVDVTSPIVGYIDYTVRNKYAAVVLQVEEEHLQEIKYINWNQTRIKEQRFCSILRTGDLCKNNVALVDGENVIEFVITDKAGNEVRKNLTIGGNNE